MNEDELIEQLEREAIAQENIPLDEFEELLAAASKDLEVTGGLAGLCPACNGTGYVHKSISESGLVYTGIEFRKLDDSIIPVTCNHGEDVSDGFGF